MSKLKKKKKVDSMGGQSVECPLKKNLIIINIHPNKTERKPLDSNISICLSVLPPVISWKEETPSMIFFF